MLVKEIMEKKVVTLRPDDTLKEVATKLAENDISGAPVVDDGGQVIGIVSEADIISTLEKNLKELKMVYLSPALTLVGLSFKERPLDKKTEDVFRELQDIKVSSMMHTNVKTVGPEDNIKAVINIISSGKINRVPVVDNGKLVGIVTRGDIIRSMSKIVK